VEALNEAGPGRTVRDFCELVGSLAHSNALAELGGAQPSPAGASSAKSWV